MSNRYSSNVKRKFINRPSNLSLDESAGFKNIDVVPKMIYVDGSKPSLIEGFTKKTFIAMIEGIKEQALSLKLIDENTWEKGITDLYKTATSSGIFCYTFFKGVAIK